ncbi:hypothetical protein [Sphingosinithalassobacter portus]|uniref:hypothetical protein n=1 Tax=Stakelama portus TaxID=2676234 RepID=UPI0011AB8A02|nr:hypothetical protein [Sphingosinithalassobacter portus]
MMGLAISLLLHIGLRPDPVACLDPAQARARAGEQVDLAIAVVQAGVHDSVEAQQVDCPNHNQVLLVGDQRAVRALVDAQVGRNGGVVHARVTGIVQIIPAPPGGGSSVFALRLGRVDDVRVVPASAP